MLSAGAESAVAVRPSLRALDFVALMKPRVTSLVVFTTAGGLYLAPGHLPTSTVLLVLFGTILAVGGANALNMYIERESDALMHRTARRPLPSGRMAPGVALAFGIALAVASIPTLALGVNGLTAFLAAVALVSYVLIYTPMKRRTPAALLVGAVPGAIPPLMGWTAATNRIDAAGALLFSVLFLWQVPHFLAIGLYAVDDYARGGIKVLPLVAGVHTAKRRIVLFAAALLPVSLALVPLGVAGKAYFVCAFGLGSVFLGWGVWGWLHETGRAWARSLFIVSLVYLTALFIALAVEGRTHG